MPTIFLSAILFLAQAAGAAQATGRVSGRITTPDGGPAANIRVMAMAAEDAAAPAGSVIAGSAQTDRSGNYRIEDLPSGRYYITAGLVDIPSYYPGVAQQADATVLSIAARASLQRIDFVQVRPTSLKVRGRVVRTNVQPPQPMGGSEVALYLWGTPPLKTVTAADGTFEFQYVRPGAYDANVLGPVTAKRVPVVVADKDVTGLQLEVIPRNQVTGRVVVEGGGPTPRVIFSVEEAGGTVHMPAADMLSFTLKEVLVEERGTLAEPSTPKAIQLNTQFSLRLSENPSQFRTHKTSVSLTVRKDSDQSSSFGLFSIDRPAHATRKSDGAELSLDISQVAGRWEVTRTEFLADVPFEGNVRRSWGTAAPPPTWRLTILKGSTVTWPSSINGKVVAN